MVLTTEVGGERKGIAPARLGKIVPNVGGTSHVADVHYIGSGYQFSLTADESEEIIGKCFGVALCRAEGECWQKYQVNTPRASCVSCGLKYALIQAGYPDTRQEAQKPKSRALLGMALLGWILAILEWLVIYEREVKK